MVGLTARGCCKFHHPPAPAPDSVFPRRHRGYRGCAGYSGCLLTLKLAPVASWLWAHASSLLHFWLVVRHFFAASHAAISVFLVHFIQRELIPCLDKHLCTSIFHFVLFFFFSLRESSSHSFFSFLHSALPQVTQTLGAHYGQLQARNFLPLVIVKRLVLQIEEIEKPAPFLGKFPYFRCSTIGSL